MNGETITLRIPRVTGTDAGGQPIVVFDTQDVEDVLVAPTSTVNVFGSTRPSGDELVWDLYVPKAWTWQSLRGARVLVRGEDLGVVGDPHPWPEDLTPGDYNLVLQARKVKG